MAKPLLPKRLFTKVKTAQAKVTAARSNILSSEKRIAQAQERIDEFYANPEAFAARYYGSHGIESYPVTTNVARNEEEIEYRTRTRERRAKALGEAEANLLIVEETVLAEVAAMRPSNGRVPWPRPLKPFDRYREEWAADEERIRLEHLVYYETAKREAARLEAIEDAEIARQQAIEEAESDRQWKARLASLTPEQRAAEKEAGRQFLDALKAGEFTVADVLAHLRSKQTG